MPVFVDIDFTQLRPDRMLTKLRDKRSKLDISFFIQITYEQLPKICVWCVAFTHDMEDYKKGSQLRSKIRGDNEDIIKELKNSQL